MLYPLRCRHLWCITLTPAHVTASRMRMQFAQFITKSQNVHFYSSLTTFNLYTGFYLDSFTSLDLSSNNKQSSSFQQTSLSGDHFVLKAGLSLCFGARFDVQYIFAKCFAKRLQNNALNNLKTLTVKICYGFYLTN